MNESIFLVVDFDSFVCKTLNDNAAVADVEDEIFAGGNAWFHDAAHDHDFVKRAVEVRDNVVTVAVVIKESVLAVAAEERIVAFAAPE